MTAMAHEGIVHVAGLWVVFAGRARQRCSWCGACLLDEFIRPELTPWPTGTLVQSSAKGLEVLPVPAAGELPPHVCAKLDPAVTGMPWPSTPPELSLRQAAWRLLRRAWAELGR